MVIRNYNRIVSDYFEKDREPPEGEVGIEIEVEGRNLPQFLASYWDVHPDGSLRGESAEYVLLKPIKRDNVLPYLKYLHKKLENSTISDSVRTSVHVHINMAQKTVLQVYVILIVYFILEELIIELAGHRRIGNLFCLRIKDAEYLLEILDQAAQKDNYKGFSSESQLRYAAVNICALYKFNSLEFRAMRGTVDPIIISDWVDLLLTLCDNALIFYKTPLEIVRDFSAVGPKVFAQKILDQHLTKFAAKDIHKILWGSVRLVQDLAYSTIWEHSDYKPIKRVFSKVKKKSLNDVLDQIRPSRVRNSTLSGLPPAFPPTISPSNELLSATQLHQNGGFGLNRLPINFPNDIVWATEPVELDISDEAEDVEDDLEEDRETEF